MLIDYIVGDKFNTCRSMSRYASSSYKENPLRSHSPTIALLILTTMSNLPPLPKIEGDVDLMLEVFTHSSLRFGSATMIEDYGDIERLAELGAKVLELTVTNQLYLRRPFLDSKDIQVSLSVIRRFSVIANAIWIR